MSAVRFKRRYCQHCRESLGKWDISKNHELTCEFCGKQSLFPRIEKAMSDIKDDQPQIEVTPHSEALARLETAARLYCEKAGYDPDFPVPKPHPLGLQVPFSRPNWMDVAQELYDLQMKLVCLKEAADGKPAPAPLGKIHTTDVGRG